MKTVFVDTSALIALGSRRDFFHSMALEPQSQLKSNKRRFVTTSAVLFESGNAFNRENLRMLAVETIEAIQVSDRWNYRRITILCEDKQQGWFARHFLICMGASGPILEV